MPLAHTEGRTDAPSGSAEARRLAETKHMKTNRPRIFIGSSAEALKVAYGIQENLEYDALCQVWDQGIFDLTANALDNLLEATSNFDFAIFVFQPDDIAKIRNSEFKVVRDNLIFELGLFVSRLSKENVFFLIPRDEEELHLPTDLLGITPGKYDHQKDDDKLLGALGPFCNKVRRMMKKKWDETSSEAGRKSQDKPDSCKTTEIDNKQKTISEEIEHGVYKDYFGNYKITLHPTVFFHHRICGAFPGVEGLEWFTDPEEALDRLELLLKEPTFFEKCEGHGITCDPFWWFRGIRALYIKRFKRINQTRCLLNSDELEIDKIAVFRSNAYWQSFVYIQIKADCPIGIYSQTKDDIERMVGNFGYAWEEYGLFDDKPITRSCYDDGAAVIDGKVVDTFGAELRARYLSKYNFLVTSKFSPINRNEFEITTDKIINEILSKPELLEELVAYINTLPRHRNDT